METEIPTALRAAITELLDLTLQNAHRKPDVFVEWYGHVNSLSVRTFPGKWSQTACDFYDVIPLKYNRDEALTSIQKAVEHVRNLYSSSEADES